MIRSWRAVIEVETAGRSHAFRWSWRDHGRARDGGRGCQAGWGVGNEIDHQFCTLLGRAAAAGGGRRFHFSFPSGLAGPAAHDGSTGSFTELAEMIPTAFSRPAGASAVGIDCPVKLKKCTGCQSSSKALRIAIATNFGEPALNRTFAPVAFSSSRPAWYYLLLLS